MEDLSFNEIINKKKQRQELTEIEIKWIINEYITNGAIADYQMSALLMAIWFNGLTEQELNCFVDSYINSGKQYLLKDINGWKADKHSTGGVGDKTSLVFAPLVASYGIKVAKMSGRALRETGGTIDKLESIPGWKENISEAQFTKIVNDVGMSIMGASSEITPADKKIYMLRDVTGTVDSIPLIAASIMSKKLAIKCDSIILDVKVGNGAFMTTLTDAKKLANLMIKIGKKYHRNVIALLTDMNKPLGRTIGNALEIREAYQTLLGQGPDDLNELCITAVAYVLLQAKVFTDLSKAKLSVAEKLASGIAAPILVNFIKAQGGNWEVMNEYEKHFSCQQEIKITAASSGYVNYISADTLGYLALDLGAGRKLATDKLDYGAGIYLNKINGEKVAVGETIMTFYTNKAFNKNWKEQAEKSFEIVPNYRKEKIIKTVVK